MTEEPKNPGDLDATTTQELLEPYYISIGQAAVAWASLEFQINAVIWSLAGISQQQGMCLTSQLPNIQSRARALLSLFRTLGGDEAVAVKVNKFFSNEVSAVALLRNRIVHDPLAVGDKGNVVRISITADKTLNAKLVEEPLAEANTAYERTKELMSGFDLLRKEMMAALPASVKKPAAPQLVVRPPED